MQEPDTMRDGGLIAGMSDFGFNRFITLSVIKVLYILGLVMIVLVWLAAMGSAWNAIGVKGLLFGFVFFTVLAAIYAIFLRVGLELIVVVFRIGENTRKLVEARGG